MEKMEEEEWGEWEEQRKRELFLNWVRKSLEDVECSKHKEPFTISKLPENISRASLYKPRMVIIGPFNDYDSHVKSQAMSFHKRRLLRSFLSRNSELGWEAYLQALESLAPDAGKYYGDLVDIRSFDFTSMLLLDGCFILELFFKWLDEDPDDLFTERWGLTMIISDLLLIENQIPFFVIERLFNMVMAGEAENRRIAFLNLLARFLMNDQELSHTSLEIWPEKIYHILHLYHYFLTVPNLSQEGKTNDQTVSPLWKQKLIQWSPTADQWGAKRPSRQIPGAVELYEAGVKFKRNSSFKNLFDVKFVGGTLKIPPLQIDSNKKILLANLLALESQKTCRNQTVTSYITLMDSLISTKEDVALLQHKGVIHNKLSSHKEAAVFFNQLGDRLSIDNVNPYFVELFRKVQLSYDSSLNQSWARLKHDYFNSFWSIISVIAGVILLGLTMAQTFFTIYPYYRPRS